MTHTAGLAAAALGLLARLYSLKRLRGTRDLRRFRKLQGAFRGAVIFILVKLYRFRFRRAFERTRFELPNLGISDPFRRLHELVTAPEEKDPPRFMIHAGDQIYFDVPFPNLEPRHSEYRRTYRQTWFEAPKLRQFLAECPHYMILDDHDIVDGFDNDRPMPAGRDPRDYSTPALAAYEEYVHCRQRDANGSEHFFYTFDYGSVPFFVLDTRTERSASKEQMIDGPQLKKFTEWLCTHSDKLKFVVSSVAFVAELRAPDQRRGSASSGANGEDPWADDRNDKWCGRPFRAQREAILECIYSNGVDKLVFLVGDMHCTYHATMRLGGPARGLTLHELAGGPAYQLQFASREDFYDQCRGSISVENEEGKKKRVPYITSLRRVHGAGSSVLKIAASSSETSSSVRWEVVSTAEKLGLTEKRDKTEVGDSTGFHATTDGDQPTLEEPTPQPALSGRISFWSRPRRGA